MRKLKPICVKCNEKKKCFSCETSILDHVIKNCDYIKNVKNSNKKSSSSLSYLIDRKLSQSECIKLGYAVEHVLKDLILFNTKLKEIKKKVENQKERDHLFCDNINKIIYYAEIKTNINLDTEKSKATCKKCLDIVEELKKDYRGYNIKWALVTPRYIKNNDIPKKLKK